MNYNKMYDEKVKEFGFEKLKSEIEKGLLERGLIKDDKSTSFEQKFYLSGCPGIHFSVFFMENINIKIHSDYKNSMGEWYLEDDPEVDIKYYTDKIEFSENSISEIDEYFESVLNKCNFFRNKEE